MTVQELIDKLQAYPKYLEVRLQKPVWPYIYEEISQATELSFDIGPPDDRTLIVTTSDWAVLECQ